MDENALAELLTTDDDDDDPPEIRFDIELPDYLTQSVLPPR
jgi:hypothetical protein